MNFQTILEELDRLYDEDKAKAVEEAAKETAEEEVVKEELTEKVMTEAAEDEEEIEIVEDEEDEVVENEEVEEAPIESESTEEVMLVLECANCGAVMVKASADVNADEETGLANMEESCQYCEATDGYKVLGMLVPYGEEEPVEDIAEEAPAEVVD